MDVWEGEGFALGVSLVVKCIDFQIHKASKNPVFRHWHSSFHGNDPILLPQDKIYG